MKSGRILKTVLDIIELYIPMTALCILFLTFIWAIIKRYVFNSPCNWATDVELGAYIWLVLFSASYVMRLDKHVRFTMVYDLFGKKVQFLIRVASNLFVSITFGILFIPTVKHLIRLRTIGPALQLPLKFYYMPIIWFIACVIINSLISLVRDINIISTNNEKLADSQ